MSSEKSDLKYEIDGIKVLCTKDGMQISKEFGRTIIWKKWDFWFSDHREEIETLQKQVDSMKNCSNCEGTRYEAFVECPLDIKLCNGKWKLKKSEV